MQRPAEKGHLPPDGLAAGQAGDGLVDHRLEDRGRQVGLGGPFVDEGLDVGLGENAAAGGDGIDLLRVPGGGVEALGIGLQKRGHLVDEGPGPPGTDAVHALFQPAGEIDDLGVLAPQLDGGVGIGGHRLQSGGHGHHLLDKGDAQGLAQIHAAGAGDGRTQGAGAQRGPGLG